MPAGPTGRDACATRNSAGKMPAGPTAKMAVRGCPVLRGFLRCGHALPVQVDFTDAFYPSQNVINGLTADSHQFSADDARHKITGQIQNLLWRRAFETFAENRSHRSSKRLHFRAERHPNVCVALLIHTQINAHGVCALLVFSDVDEIEIFVVAGFLSLRAVCIRNERLAPFVFGQRFKQSNDLIQFSRIHRHFEFIRIALSVIPSEVEESRGTHGKHFSGCLDFARHDV